MIDSLKAGQFLQARMTACSWQAGWRSLLLRSYIDPPVVDDVRTPATADPLIVLVTGGRCDIEARYGRRTQKATYGPGSLGMTGPGEEASLSWSSDQPHTTLQLHLPARTLLRVSGELSLREALARVPSSLHFTDPVVRQLMLALANGLRSGAPDLYAETAAEFLAVHILTRYGGQVPAPTRSAGFERLRKVDDFLHANLGSSLTLEAMANVAGLSKFHLLRTFKQAYSETPLQRLTRMRMDHAKTLLVATEAPITTVAFECGYATPAHFAAAFRRFTGVTPSEFRRVR